MLLSHWFCHWQKNVYTEISPSGGKASVRRGLFVDVFSGGNLSELGELSKIRNVCFGTPKSGIDGKVKMFWGRQGSWTPLWRRGGEASADTP